MVLLTNVGSKWRQNIIERVIIGMVSNRCRSNKVNLCDLSQLMGNGQCAQEMLKIKIK